MLGNVVITRPTSREVFQRNGSNNGTVVVSGSSSSVNYDTVEARAGCHPGFSCTPVAYTTIYTAALGHGSFTGSFTVPKGWYDIYVRFRAGGVPVDVGTQPRVGVGEVFLTMGQSNAANYGNTPYTPTDERVVSKNGTTGLWAAGADPQQSPCEGPNGSIWGRLGDLLAAAYDAPIGFACSAINGSTSATWAAPSGTYYASSVTNQVQGFPANGFRAILWHQGETDALNSVTQSAYFNNVSSTIAQSRVDAGWTIPWMVSKVSLSNTVTAPQQAPIQAAQAQLVTDLTSVFTGIDGDSLGGTYRYDGTHFTGAGQDLEASMYQTAIQAAFSLGP